MHRVKVVTKESCVDMSKCLSLYACAKHLPWRAIYNIPSSHFSGIKLVEVHVATFTGMAAKTLKLLRFNGTNQEMVITVKCSCVAHLTTGRRKSLTNCKFFLVVGPIGSIFLIIIRPLQSICSVTVTQGYNYVYQL